MAAVVIRPPPAYRSAAIAPHSSARRSSTPPWSVPNALACPGSVMIARLNRDTDAGFAGCSLISRTSREEVASDDRGSTVRDHRSGPEVGGRGGRGGGGGPDPAPPRPPLLLAAGSAPPRAPPGAGRPRGGGGSPP